MWGGWRKKTAWLARETARLAANGAMPDESPAAGTPAETGAAAAPAEPIHRRAKRVFFASLRGPAIGR